jgi:hypothetical protein
MTRRARLAMTGAVGMAAAALLFLAPGPQAPVGVMLEPLWNASRVLERSYGPDVTSAELVEGAAAAMAEAKELDLPDLVAAGAENSQPVPEQVPEGYESLWDTWLAAAAGVSPQDAPELVHAAIDGMVSATGDPRASVVSGDYREEREYYDDKLETTLTPEDMPLATAGTQHLAGDIGYLHVTRFAADAPEVVNEQLAELAMRGVRALIVDLRGNAGGLPSAAAGVADLFLAGGPVYIEENLDGAFLPVGVSSGGPALGIPMVVIVDERTMGAAELYAAAIQDHGRAALIGSPTPGDTAVHRPYQVGPDLAVVVLAGRWHAPSGRDIQQTGLVPDAVVPLLDEDVVAGYDRQMFVAYSLLWELMGGAVGPG